MQTSIYKICFAYILIFNMISLSGLSVTVSTSWNNADAEVYIAQSYDLDESTDLRVLTGLGEGTIIQTQWASGQGNNNISQYLGNEDQSAYSAITSESNLGLNTNTLAT